MRRVEVPVLIIGGGLSGLSASIFLADLGVDALLVERHPSTSHLPKAHYLNQRTMEIFRRHGVADAVYACSTPRENLGKIIWHTSLGGDGPFDRVVYGEGDSMGGGALAADYDAKGATHPTNIPQVRLEPILARVAEQRRPNGVLFRHELESLSQDDDGVSAIVRDLDRDEELHVRCQYLVGADAGKTVGPAVGISMAGPRLPVDFVVVWVRADLSEYIPDDSAIMRYLIHPSRPAQIGALLAYGPEHWDRHSEEWGVNFSRDPSLPPLDEASAIAESRAVLGLDEDVEMSVHRISQWTLEVAIADAFVNGRVLIIGDAAHKHTPGAGLGANSGIQDAHNIAWKLALVLAGLAPPTLLHSYEVERRPVVTRNAEWSGFTMQNLLLYMTAAGIVPSAPREQREAQFSQLLADSPVGAASRALLREVFKLQRMEIAAHDMEMGFTYDRGAVVDDGSDAAWRDPLGAEYRPTSRPGSRLPHAWLHVGGERVSTHDLVPIGGFLLLTDSSGRDWTDAAERLAIETRLTIRAVRIGDDAEDRSGAWQAACEVGDGGALLVRPDGHIGYRAVEPVAEAYTTLHDALATILAGGTDATTPEPTRPEAHGLHGLASALVPDRETPSR